MFKETMMPESEEKKEKEPEFIPKPGPVEQILVKQKMVKEKMIKESGFNEEECGELIRICRNAFGDKFAYQEFGGNKKLAAFHVEKIEKISDTEAKVVGIGNSKGFGGENWEMKVVKEDDTWRVEKAIEV